MNNTQIIAIREAVQASMPLPTGPRGRGKPTSNITAAQQTCANMAGVTLRHWQRLERGLNGGRPCSIRERSRELLLIKLAIAGISIANTYQQSNIDS